MFVEMAPGALVAEVGAGKGELTLAVARRVGNSGRVCTTEIDPKALGHLEDLTAKEKNITVVKALKPTKNLPPAFCDSIFIRLVNHHLTKPTEIDASL